MSRTARAGPFLVVLSIASGIALVAGAQTYYIWGLGNSLKKNDPIGKEAGFAACVDAAEAAPNTIGGRWFATTDYRIYSMLRWHLKDIGVPVVQVNERRRFIGFAEPLLEGSAGLFVGSKSDPDAAILATTGAVRQNIGMVDLTWRGVLYDGYLFQKLTNWKPALLPPRDHPFERAHPY
jgi:hypothetical protein